MLQRAIISATRTHFIESKSLYLLAPRIASQEIVVVFGSISEARQILAEHYDNLRAHLPGLLDRLQLVQASAAGFIVARDNDVLLLYCEWQET